MRSVHRPVLRAAGLLGLVVAAFTEASPTQAQGTVIVACANNNGMLRQVSSPGECKNNETPVQWNIVGTQGPIGPQGATGATGAIGAQGPVGPQGAKGDQGSQGVAGPTGPTGVAGPQGAKGDQGQQGPAGKGFTVRGAFAPGKGYVMNDVVSHNGSSWIGIDTFPAGVPGVSGSWMLLAQQGLDGAQGPTGPAGPAGAQGPVGQVVGGFEALSEQGVTRAFVVPAGVTRILVELWGGGGGGGAADWTSSGGGGAGGGYLRAVVPVVPGETLWRWVGGPGKGGRCNQDQTVSSTGGSETAFWDANGLVFRAYGGGGGSYLGGGGEPTDYCERYTGLRVIPSLLCRTGAPGTSGGVLGQIVLGGRTPTGSLSPDREGGGPGGYRWHCDAGDGGNSGMILISW